MVTNVKIDLSHKGQPMRVNLVAGTAFVYEADPRKLFLVPSQFGCRVDVSQKDIEIGGEFSGSLADARLHDAVIVVDVTARRSATQPIPTECQGKLMLEENSAMEQAA